MHGHKKLTLVWKHSGVCFVYVIQCENTSSQPSESAKKISVKTNFTLK